MERQTAVVLGSTGLTGRHVVEQLVGDTRYERIRLLVRRQVKLTDPKVEVQVVDFSNVEDFKNKLGSGHVIFCCIGTTMRQMRGDEEAYRRVDFDIPMHAAEFGIAAGFEKFVLQSSVGAHASSGTFYLRLKGEVEQEIAGLGYKSFHVFQPSMLLGERKEFRFGESIGKVVMKATSSLFMGKASKYKAVEASDVARAMIAAARTNVTGKHVYLYNEIKKLSQHGQ